MLIFWLLTIIMLLVRCCSMASCLQNLQSLDNHCRSPPGPMFNSPLFFNDLFLLQEFGDSARARRLYADDDDDEEEQELEPNPKLSQGKSNGLTPTTPVNGFYPFKCCLFAKAAPDNIPQQSHIPSALLGQWVVHGEWALLCVTECLQSRGQSP